MPGSPLPSYDTLWVNYYDYMNYPDSAQVKRLIGGLVDADWITNTCAIRMSHALNEVGIVLPRGFKGLNTVKGGNGRRYAFRVRELRKWFDTALKKPEFDLDKKASSTFDKSSIAAMKGIIAFDIAFSDATGHIDLWDGTQITAESLMSKDYYDSATRITVWKSS